MNIVIAIASLGVLYFLAHAFAAIFSRTKIPDALELIIVGLCLGPIFGIVAPDHLGAVGPVLVTITLIVILFESGLSISLNTLVKAWSRGVALTTINFLATTIIIGTAALLLTDLTPLTSFMLGAIVGGTSSAVVIPLIRQLKMQKESSTILLFESALTDVLCIVVALVFIDAYKGEAPSWGLMIGDMIASFIVAAALGVAGAILWSILLNKTRTLENAIFATPFFVFVIFGLAEVLGYSGYIAALAFGITIGNMDLLKLRLSKIRLFRLPLKPIALNETERKLFAEVVFLLHTFFFVYVGILIQITNSQLMYIGLILTVLIFILRIPVVRLSTSKSTPIEDVSLMAVIVPKGLAAAALASLPLQQGISGGEVIQSVVFAIVLSSILLTSTLIFLMHKTVLSKLYRRMFSGFGTLSEPVVESQGPTDRKSNSTEPRYF